MRNVPVLRRKRYANYLWVDPVFQFQAILLPSRARSTNCSSARPEDVCSPGSSRLAPGLDVLRHRAGVLRERRLPRADLPHEVHRIWNHFPSASVYQKTLTRKGGCRIFLSVAKEKGEYLDQPRIRRICVIASLLDVITSRYKAKFVDQPFPLWNYSSEICAANAEKRKGLCAGVRFRAPRIGRVLHALRPSVYALGDRHRHAQLLRFPHHIAGHRLE